MRRAGLLLLGLMIGALAACSPTDMADKVGRRAAETVVLPVVSDRMPGGNGSAVARCIIDAASAEDIKLLARDVGVVAGSSTTATVLRIAAQPNARDCIARVNPAAGALL